MSTAYSRCVNYASPIFSLIDEVPPVEHNPDMIERGRNLRSPQAIGDRIRWTRIALGLNGVQFAKRCGLSDTALNNYEAGKRRISLDAAFEICNSVGVNILWLYQGDMADLRPDFADKIRQAMKDEPDRIPRTRRSQTKPKEKAKAKRPKTKKPPSASKSR